MKPLPAQPFTRVSPDLVCWSAYDDSVRTELTSHALKTSKGWWLVDPISIEKSALQQLHGNEPILGILLTNENHERAAWELSDLLNLPVHAHEATLGLMERNPDYFFRDKDILNGGLRVIHLPGFPRGECCFYSSSQAILLMGDALIHLKETGFTYLPEKYCQDPVLAKKSLQRLTLLNFSIMTFAHGSPIIASADTKLRQLLNPQ